MLLHLGGEPVERGLRQGWTVAFHGEEMLQRCPESIVTGRVPQEKLFKGLRAEDGVVKLREASLVAPGSVKPVFVADFDITQLKWGGMTVFRPLCAPFGGGISRDILNFLQRLLNVWLKVRAGLDVIVF